MDSNARFGSLLSPGFSKVPKRTLNAAIFLTGDATLWWEGNALSNNASWGAFVVAFRAAFQLKMTSTVSDYVARTRKYMSFLCPHDINAEARKTLEQAATSCFLKSLIKWWWWRWWRWGVGGRRWN